MQKIEFQNSYYMQEGPGPGDDDSFSSSSSSSSSPDIGIIDPPKEVELSRKQKRKIKRACKNKADGDRKRYRKCRKKRFARALERKRNRIAAADLAEGPIGLNNPDGDSNCFIDEADHSIVQDNLFKADTDRSTGDYNGDGLTDGSDFNIWNTLNKELAGQDISEVYPDVTKITITALAAETEVDGSMIPNKGSFALDSTSSPGLEFTPLFSNQAILPGLTQDVCLTSPTGTLVFQGSTDLPDFVPVDTDDALNAIVLVSGMNINEVINVNNISPAGEGQSSLELILQDRLDSSGILDMADNEFIVIFELSDADGRDFNDLVLSITSDVPIERSLRGFVVGDSIGNWPLIADDMGSAANSRGGIHDPSPNFANSQNLGSAGVEIISDGTFYLDEVQLLDGMGNDEIGPGIDFSQKQYLIAVYQGDEQGNDYFDNLPPVFHGWVNASNLKNINGFVEKEDGFHELGIYPDTAPYAIDNLNRAVYRHHYDLSGLEFFQQPLAAGRWVIEVVGSGPLNGIGIPFLVASTFEGPRAVFSRGIFGDPERLVPRSYGSPDNTLWWAMNFVKSTTVN